MTFHLNGYGNVFKISADEKSVLVNACNNNVKGLIFMLDPQGGTYSRSERFYGFFKNEEHMRWSSEVRDTVDKITNMDWNNEFNTRFARLQRSE